MIWDEGSHRDDSNAKLPGPRWSKYCPSVHHSRAKREPVSFRPKKWITGIHGTVRMYLYLSLSSFITRQIPKQRYFRHLLHLFWSQFQEVKPRSQTTEKKQKYNCFWQNLKRTCQNRDFCNADGPVGAEGSHPLLQGIVELLRIPSELTLNQQIHRAGMVAVVFQHELLPWKGEEILSDQCCCVSRKRSENQIKLNFHENLGPMTNQEGKFLIVSYSFCPFHFIA